MNKALFLDRDNTLIIDVPYNGDPDKVELIPGVIHVMRRFQDLGYLLFIISNQSGVGRGYITESDMNKVNEKLILLLKNSEIEIKKIYNCIHHPDAACQCRKPNPGLLLKAAKEFNIDLNKSIMLGDKVSDVQAGINAGCKINVLISNDENIQFDCLKIKKIKDILKLKFK